MFCQWCCHFHRNEHTLGTSVVKGCVSLATNPLQLHWQLNQDIARICLQPLPSFSTAHFTIFGLKTACKTSLPVAILVTLICSTFVKAPDVYSVCHTPPPRVYSLCPQYYSQPHRLHRNPGAFGEQGQVRDFKTRGDQGSQTREILPLHLV